MDHNHTCCATTLEHALAAPVNEYPDAQARFNFTYVTVKEIADIVDVSRVAVQHAIERGVLPAPIVVNNNQCHLWERLEVAPHVEAWRQAVATKRKMADIGRRSRKGVA